ncbi:MAG: GGDEF domain-containing protein [bacterium JZ-2024 1]
MGQEVLESKIWKMKDIFVRAFLARYPKLDRDMLEKEISGMLIRAVDALRKEKPGEFVKELRQFFILWMLRGVYLEELEGIIRDALKTGEKKLGPEVYLRLSPYLNSEAFYQMLEVYSSALKEIALRQREELSILTLISESPRADWKKILRRIFRKVLKVLNADAGVMYFDMEKFSFFVQSNQFRISRNVKSIVNQIVREESFSPHLREVLRKVTESGMLKEILLDWTPEVMVKEGKQCPLCQNQPVMFTRLSPGITCPFLDIFRVKTFLCFPFHKEGKKVGALWIGRTGGSVFEPGDKEFLKLLSGEIFRGLDNFLMYNQLYELSIKDSLTGLLNRRAILEALKREHLRAKRYGSIYSLVMADLDYFKEINDRYGHQAGDEVLRVFSRILQKNIRKTDYVARYGGEEFLIVLPETDAKSALRTAERIRRIFEKTEVPVGEGKTVNVTASFGVCSYPQSAKGLDTLMKKVDDFLYQAKLRGKNQVFFSG